MLILLVLLGVIIGACVALGYAVLGTNELSGEHTHVGNQELFETAERVITACSESRLNEDMTECQNLCHDKLCCFDTVRKYNCENDENKACAVFAGCEALIDGALLYEDELDEE